MNSFYKIRFVSGDFFGVPQIVIKIVFLYKSKKNYYNFSKRILKHKPNCK